MKATSASVALAALLALTSVPANAKGCIKGAIVGGVAGHYAGRHGFIGAQCADGSERFVDRFDVRLRRFDHRRRHLAAGRALRVSGARGAETGREQRGGQKGTVNRAGWALHKGLRLHVVSRRRRLDAPSL